MFDRYISCVLSTLLAIALTLSMAVKADELTPVSTTTDSALYLGVKAGWMHYQNACEAWNTACDGNDAAYGLYAGYQFTSHFALETAYLDLGQAVASYPQTGFDETYTGTMKAWETSTIGRMGISQQWDLFAKLGTLAWQGENKGPYSIRSDSGWAPQVGIGIEYRWSDTWVTRLEYQYTHELGSEEIGGSHGHLTTLGLTYRFGQRSHAISSPNLAPVQTVQPAQPVAQAPLVAPQKVEIAPIQRVVLFDFDRSSLKHVNELNAVIERLTQHPKARVHIRGYADSIGASEYNKALSMRRAQAVSAHLIANGIKPQQIELAAFGESFPVEANENPLKRHLNRRVELEIPAMMSE
ncbi:hypothetical protein BEL05_06190 [Shewanella colwelliana]|uniref:OmpA-like domain-containing protein n=1 Tax=Shewanella colwelliana TaxID=23 RepID=A0A1E5IRB3_SHECO|nr:OmpA family protein [Shewanella colwelliana]OEG72987.1 hypothetical protein BEL05_06190 [Shewanella colwelliana]